MNFLETLKKVSEIILRFFWITIFQFKIEKEPDFPIIKKKIKIINVYLYFFVFTLFPKK